MPISFKLAQFRRVAPFVAPLGLAVCVGFLVSRSHNESDRRESPVPRANASAIESKSPSLTALRASGRSAELETLRLISAPRSPELSRIVETFRASDGRVANTLAADLFAYEKGKQVSLLVANIELDGTVDSVVFRNGARHIGVTINEPQGRFTLSLTEDDKALASLMFEGESFAFSFDGYAQNGAWQMKETTVSSILCAPIGAKYSSAGVTQAYPFKASSRPRTNALNGPVSAPPVLNSNPTSTYVIYCDFDGEVVTHPLWNTGKTIDAKPHARADDAAFVTKVWARVAEDFASFDINVTTDRAVFDAAAVSRRAHCVITPTDTAMPGSGGVAYLNSFGDDVPSWAFNAGEASCADTISHEIGHMLGLSHDGTTTGDEYYGGHGSGVTSWAPIMGAYFADGGNENLTQWSKGEYPKANNQEDDLKIITTSNGFGYRIDDKGNSSQQAADLAFVSKDQVSDSGIIERTADADWFRFAVGKGFATINIKTIDVESTDTSSDGANLALAAEIYDGAGKLIKTSNSTNSLGASLSLNLAAGDYFLKVQGASRGTLSTGFSNYASLGQYKITGTVPQPNLIAVTPTNNRIAIAGGNGAFNVSSTVSWSWSSSETWVTSNEIANQTGSQTFEYEVAPNNTQSERSATITLRSGNSVATHQIAQEGPVRDDHGDTLDTSTFVAQASSTSGKFEKAGDVDVFQINLRGTGDLVVYTTGATDTRAELLDATGQMIASNDNDFEPNFLINHPVASGIYFIRIFHAISSGIGEYRLISNLVRSPVLMASPAVREVNSFGGILRFEAISNTSWSWACSEQGGSGPPSWVKSGEAYIQMAQQPFDYEILPNNTGQKRSATITLTGRKGSATHTIIQNPYVPDDHANNSANATVLALGGGLQGRIEDLGDVDCFSVTLPTSGTLTVSSTGNFDTYGELRDSKGASIASNDNSRDRNFSIARELNAGTYYIFVSNSGNKAIGNYGIINAFTPSKTVLLQYRAGLGGALKGNLNQSVPLGGNATAVSAMPATGFSFAKWSDGLVSASRSDRNVKSHQTVTAEFNRNLSVALVGEAPLRDTPSTAIDFGSANPGQILTKTFEITNFSPLVLNGLKVEKSGLDAASWSLPSPPQTTLNPGEKITLSVTFSSSIRGYKKAYLTASAAGIAFKSLSIPVLAFVSPPAASPVLASGPASAVAPSSSAGASQTLLQSIPGSSATNSSIEASPPRLTPISAWVGASIDGFFRYEFRLNAPIQGVPSFWVSSDGLTWQESIPLSVRFLSYSANLFEYEATLSPPSARDLIISVSEKAPLTSKP